MIEEVLKDGKAIDSRNYNSIFAEAAVRCCRDKETGCPAKMKAYAMNQKRRLGDWAPDGAK